MSDVFDALAAGDTNGVLSSSKAFVAAVHTRDLRMAKNPVFSFDVHSDRLRSQLGAMPQDKLDAIRRTAANLSGRAAHPVVSRIHVAACTELLQRTARDIGSDGAEFVLSSLSRDQLRELRNAASVVLDNTPKSAPTNVIPGMTFTRSGLENLRDEASRQFAIKVVQGNYFYSADELAKLPLAEIIEISWAIAWCRSTEIVAPHGTQALSAMAEANDKNLWGGKLDGLAAAIRELQLRSATASGALRANSSDL